MVKVSNLTFEQQYLICPVVHSNTRQRASSRTGSTRSPPRARSYSRTWVVYTHRRMVHGLFSKIYFSVACCHQQKTIQVFEYLTGAAMFQLSESCPISVENLCLQRILEHIGPFPPSFLERCQRRSDFFDEQGKESRLHQRADLTLF